MIHNPHYRTQIGGLAVPPGRKVVPKFRKRVQETIGGGRLQSSDELLNAVRLVAGMSFSRTLS
jgi:hypothetical protein